MARPGLPLFLVLLVGCGDAQPAAAPTASAPAPPVEPAPAPSPAVLPAPSRTPGAAIWARDGDRLVRGDRTVALPVALPPALLLVPLARDRRAVAAIGGARLVILPLESGATPVLDVSSTRFTLAGTLFDRDGDGTLELALFRTTPARLEIDLFFPARTRHEGLALGAVGYAPVRRQPAPESRDFAAISSAIARALGRTIDALVYVSADVVPVANDPVRPQWSLGIGGIGGMGASTSPSSIDVRTRLAALVVSHDAAGDTAAHFVLVDDRPSAAPSAIGAPIFLGPAVASVARDACADAESPLPGIEVRQGGGDAIAAIAWYPTAGGALAGRVLAIDGERVVTIGEALDLGRCARDRAPAIHREVDVRPAPGEPPSLAIAIRDVDPASIAF